jgi:hypothetical protein
MKRELSHQVENEDSLLGARSRLQVDGLDGFTKNNRDVNEAEELSFDSLLLILVHAWFVCGC